MSQPEVLTSEEIQALLKACGRGPSGVRNRALICLLWRSGLRCGEALALYPRDVRDGVLVVRHGKGDKARQVVLDSLGSSVLELWLARREALGVNGHHPVFCAITQGKQGKPLASVYVRRLLYRLCERAGVDDGDEWLASGAKRHRVHPHALRHSYAANLAMERAPAASIMYMLGHASLNTTTTYLERISPQEHIRAVREAMDASAQATRGDSP